MGITLSIRKSRLEDIPQLLELCAQCRTFMKINGNPQWPDGYPSKEVFAFDINNRQSYVCVDENDKILGTFAICSQESGYKNLKRGSWLDNAPYAVIHRVASCGKHKVGSFMMQQALKRYPSLRGDTTRQNLPMQALFKKFGFVHCGTAVIERPITHEKIEREVFQHPLRQI